MNKVERLTFTPSLNGNGTHTACTKVRLNEPLVHYTIGDLICMNITLLHTLISALSTPPQNISLIVVLSGNYTATAVDLWLMEQ